MSVTLTLMPSAIAAVIAGSPSGVAGIFTRRLGRSTSCHSSRAWARVPSVSCARYGSTSMDTRPSTPSVRAWISVKRSQAARTSAVVSEVIAVATSAPSAGSAARSASYRVPSDSAAAKIDGFVVTPTTWSWAMREARDWAPPPSSRSRDRSSSQTETPRRLSSDRWFVMCSSRDRWGPAAAPPGPSVLLGQVFRPALGRLLLRPGGGVAGGGEGLTRLGDGGLRGDAELLVEALVGGGGAVVLQAHGTAGVADDLVPALGDGGLDGDARLDGGGQHRLLVGVVLLGEPLAARHRHHPGGHALRLQRLARLERDVHLGAGGDEDDVRAAAGGLGEHVAAARDALGAGQDVTLGRPLTPRGVGDVLPGEDESGRAVGALQDGAPGDGDLGGVGGPHDVEAGDRAQRGEVLDRLVGRAVLTQADGVVGPHEGRGDPHERGEPHRRAHVVGEREEGTAVGPGEPVEGDAVEDRAHAVLTDAEVQRAPVRVAGEHRAGALDRQEGLLALHRRVVRAGEVGGAAPQLG